MEADVAVELGSVELDVQPGVPVGPAVAAASPASPATVGIGPIYCCRLQNTVAHRHIFRPDRC